MSDLSRQPLQQLQFLKLDSVFHNLESNERIVAKQAFLSVIESYHAKLPLVSYQLTGLRTDCDLLLWRSSPSFELLQDSTCRLQSAGLGKFLIPAYSYTASGPSPSLDKALRYLFVSPWSQTAPVDVSALAKRQQQVADKHPGLRLHPPLAHGLDECDSLLLCEADSPQGYLAAAPELRGLRAEAFQAAGPTFSCVLKDIRDIVDCLG